MRLGDLRGCRIGVLGYGREGRAAIGALRAHGADTDLSVLVESGPVPDDLPVKVGPFAGQQLDFDVLVRSPGVPVLHPALLRYREAGGRVLNPASLWFAERPELPVIGVTGSKGKSTTASLLAQLLAVSGRQVLLAGNIGVPLLDHLETSAEVVVLELSSYQLTDLQGRLAMGLITRLFPEHGDWHGGVAHYYASKLRLAELLNGGPLLVNATDPVLVAQTKALAGRILANQPPLVHRRDDALYLADQPLVSAADIQLPGRHNLDNAALALEAAMRFGERLDGLLPALRMFRPLRDRLEIVRDQDGVAWVNDSIATTPHATLAALQAFSGRRVILIAGGYVRPADWSPVLAHCTAEPLHGLVVMPDSGPAIARIFADAVAAPKAGICQVGDLAAAVQAAMGMIEDQAVILLSPGAASFPQFRDFEDRGEQFRRAVAACYKERSTA